MIKKMNKKGQAGTQLMVLPFLFLLLFVGAGIAAGTFLFYGQEYDFKKVDAQYLAKSVSTCIIEKNEITNILNDCRINRNVVESYMGIKVCKNNPACIAENNPTFVVGSNFVACELTGAKNNPKYPKCEYLNFTKGEDKYYLIAKGTQVFRRGE